ncbi:5'-nucleotidase C-terminal domain-containing protein [Brevibacterium litoralis]|uniref:5'-nucleotidase C-terminal domain-containing protein n=1 Tax=Brevibacterium litoralis TaxID=3138935 RepID=UPI0032EC0CAB
MRKTLLSVLGGVTALGLGCGLAVTPVGAAPLPETGEDVQLLGITDFHGRIGEYDPAIETAATVEAARADFGGPTAFLSAGDNIGASVFASSSADDTPTLEYLNALGLDASAVGNHEFDKGMDDLTGRVTDEAAFPYLGANVYAAGTQDVAPGLEGSTVIEVDGVRIGVIGVVTEATASLVSPGGIADIVFGDPTEAMNREAAALDALPEAERPEMIVVQAHLGPNDTAGTMEEAIASSSEFGDFVTNASDAVDAMFFGHTHLPADYVQDLGDGRIRPLLQGANYGSTVAQVVLSPLGEGDWTVAEHALLDTEAATIPEPGTNPVIDETTRIVEAAQAAAEGPGSVVEGSITEDLTRATDETGEEDRGAESTLGNLVADALQYGSTLNPNVAPADFALTNPGGLRDDLLVDAIYNDEAPGEVTAAELNAVLPFANDHVVSTLTGADVIQLFEQQWQPEGESRSFLHLGISEEIEVVYDSNAAEGARVQQVTVNGEPIDPAATYRVATLSFLATGGDNFTAFTNGPFEQTGYTDYEVWADYFAEHSPVAPDTAERQADVALDAVNTGRIAEDGLSLASYTDGAYTFVSNATEDVTGPFLLSFDLPEGVELQWSGAEAANAGGAVTGALPAELPVTVTDVNTATIDVIPAGESEIPFSFTGPAGDYSVDVQIQADPAAAFWDDNPMPAAYAFEGFEFSIAAADGTEEPSTEPTTEPTAEPTTDPTVEPTQEPTEAPTEATTAPVVEDATEDEGQGTSGAGDDEAGDLAYTGSNAAPFVGAGVLLLAIGGAAMVLTRRRV